MISAEGDVFDPSGVITGGKRAEWLILKEFHQLAMIRDRRHEIAETLADLKRRLADSESGQTNFFRLDKQRSLMTNKLQQIDDRIQESEFGRQQADIERFEAELIELNNIHEEARKIHAIVLKETTEIENRMQNLEKNRDAELRRLEKEVAQKRKQSEAAQAKVDNMREQYEGLAMEIEQLQSEVTAAQTDLESEQAKNAACSQEVEEQIQICDIVKDQIKGIKDQIKQQRDLIAERDHEIQQQKNIEKDTRKDIKDAERTVASAHDQIKRQADQNGVENDLRGKMLSEHDWIEQDRQMFGTPNSPYDFAFRDPAKAERALRKGIAQKDKLTGQINHRAMALLTQAEKQYEELIVKRTNVEDDLENIQESIKALDEKKKTEITNAYKEVNF